ncbi:hypothetical protein AB0F05_00835 [Streptomyces microflavus]|nr:MULTISPECIES: hypothetical protein [Streptomyces]UIZ16777.1 hypothetical protein LZ559_32530 [Streptomyces sp. R527F]WSI52203.1 hypothetical protein OG366_34240 [Streptomyces cyaneofuscatus]
MDDDARECFNRTLRRDLEAGVWDERFGHLRTRPTCEGSLVVIRATLEA